MSVSTPISPFFLGRAALCSPLPHPLPLWPRPPPRHHCSPSPSPRASTAICAITASPHALRPPSTQSPSFPRARRGCCHLHSPRAEAAICAITFLPHARVEATIREIPQNSLSPNPATLATPTIHESQSANILAPNRRQPPFHAEDG
jgi:hypothetical protein